MVMRVGVLSTANIARKNILAIEASTGAKAVCVGSRDIERAKKFADETGLEEGFGSYADVLSAAVDAVYIPLPTALHREWVVKSADAGKHVLCEKPVATNVDALVSMLRSFAARDLVFMDGNGTHQENTLLFCTSTDH